MHLEQESDFPKIELDSNLERSLREDVNLVGFPGIYPYKKSSIDLIDIDIENISPTAFYILNSNMKRVSEMYMYFENQNIDLFRLNHIEKYEEFSVIPPVIEKQNDGTFALIDGEHRIRYANSLGYKSIYAIVISDVDVPLPVIPLSWDVVREYDEIPLIKRMYNLELPEPSKYYRNLSMLGSTGERKSGN